MNLAALDAHNLGLTIGALMVPLIGLILLIVGIVERTRSQNHPPPLPPGYPASPYPQPPTGYGPQVPPGYPPFPPTPSGPPYPPYPPPGNWPPLRPKPRGTALIVAGAV